MNKLCGQLIATFLTMSKLPTPNMYCWFYFQGYFEQIIKQLVTDAIEENLWDYYFLQALCRFFITQQMASTSMFLLNVQPASTRNENNVKFFRWYIAYIINFLLF